MVTLPRKRRCFFALVLSGIVSIVVYVSLVFVLQTDECLGLQCFNRKTFLTRHREGVCILPSIDPFKGPMMDFVVLQNNTEDFGTLCPEVKRNFQLVNGRVAPLGTTFPTNILQRSVKYQVIMRSDNGDDDFALGSEVFVFKNNRLLPRIRNDFVKVSYKLEDGSRQVELLTQVSRKNRFGYRKKDIGDLNVILLGFDSTSGANFRRQLPQSYQYLVNKLDAFVFNGYSIVGDGTTPALTAMLAGIPLKIVQANTTNLDDWPWIMKDYQRKGYVTLYAEDDPQLACFNSFKRGGFGEPPADHYMRPFWLAVERQGQNGRRRNKTDTLHRVCFNGQALHNITLEYMDQFLNSHRSSPKFAFNFFSYLPHGTGEKLNLADEDILLFLRKFEKFYWQDSILIFFGDHGARIGPYRNTIQGGHEEHLPWLSVVTPPWFKNKYPEMVRNLERNRNILTSPFDVHHTLHHILNLKQGEFGSSLFAPLDPQRSCSDAGVDEHWCPCFAWQEMDVSNPVVQTAANLVIKHVNKILTRRRVYMQLCFTVHLAKILLAARATNGDRSGTYYQITVATNPGGGTFLATFHAGKDGSLTINPHVSRTNQYGRNPWCLQQQHRSLKKFCTCKKPYTKRRGAAKNRT